MSSFIIDIIQAIPDRTLQKASLITQYRQILAQLDRRLRSALEQGNQCDFGSWEPGLLPFEGM